MLHTCFYDNENEQAKFLILGGKAHRRLEKLPTAEGDLLVNNGGKGCWGKVEGECQQTWRERNALGRGSQYSSDI